MSQNYFEPTEKEITREEYLTGMSRHTVIRDLQRQNMIKFLDGINPEEFTLEDAYKLLNDVVRRMPFP